MSSNIKISDLKNNPNNPRKIDKEKFAKLVESLKQFPEMMEKRPLVCVTDPQDGKIYPLGGNMRLKALRELKFKEIPYSWVIMADDWTEEQRKEFVIKDNLAFGEWDKEPLLSLYDTNQLLDWGMDEGDFKFEAFKSELEENEENEKERIEINPGDTIEFLIKAKKSNIDDIVQLVQNAKEIDQKTIIKKNGEVYEQAK